MKSAYVALGYQCNHQCIMCPLSQGDREGAQLSCDEVLAAIEREHLQTGDHLTLSGGEPTLVPFLTDVIETLSRQGIHITLLSNSSGFADAELAGQLAAVTSPSRFNVVTAIHSADAAVHDKITGTPGSLEQSLQGLHNLLDAGVNITIKHIVTALTYEGLPDLARMICRHFPPRVEVQFTSADYSGNALANADILRITFAEAQEKFEEALHILTRGCRMPYRISMIEMPLCACSAQYWKYFRSTGDMLNFYLAPNAHESGGVIHQMPNGCAPAYSECERCDVRCFCPGAWNTAYELMGTQLLRRVECRMINN